MRLTIAPRLRKSAVTALAGSHADERQQLAGLPSRALARG